jgi:hypothetical protein
MFKQNAFLNLVSTLFGCGLQLTPVKNFPPVSTTPVVNFTAGIKDTGVVRLELRIFSRVSEKPK